MPAPTGFEWTLRRNGEVGIYHHGRQVTVLRGRVAEKLISRLEKSAPDEEQHLLARATGNYKRGNERT